MELRLTHSRRSHLVVKLKISEANRKGWRMIPWLSSPASFPSGSGKSLRSSGLTKFQSSFCHKYAPPTSMLERIWT